MRFYFLFTAVLLFPFTSFSQNDIDALLKFPQDTISRYDTSRIDVDYVMLEMDFASSAIKNPEVLAKLNRRLIYRIDLVYTAFRQSETFEQPRLNRNRLEALGKVYPRVFSEFFITWRFVAQTAARNENDARKYFHGFVIYYLDKELKTTEEEVAYMIELLDSDSLGTAKREIRERYKFKKRKEYTGKYFPRSKKKKKQGIVYDKKGFGRKKHYIIHTDTLVSYDTVVVFEPSEKAGEFIRNREDTSVMAILDRHQEWKNMLVVCDVTGSMSPYSTQVLMWHKLNFNARRTVGYVFFNDGDNKPDDKKKIGQTGGMHYVDGNQLQEVEDTALAAMLKGSGGLPPENNIEALLAAISRYPKFDELVMIADNWANIEDFKLANKLKKPVHIILCGVENGVINTQYLDLARMTKGTVHTLESDLNNLMKLNEGQAIEVEGIQYRLKNGRFYMVNKL